MNTGLFWVGFVTLEFTSAGLAPDAPFKDNFAAHVRLTKSQD